MGRKVKKTLDCLQLFKCFLQILLQKRKGNGCRTNHTSSYFQWSYKRERKRLCALEAIKDTFVPHSSLRYPGVCADTAGPVGAGDQHSPWLCIVCPGAPCGCFWGQRCRCTSLVGWTGQCLAGPGQQAGTGACSSRASVSLNSGTTHTLLGHKRRVEGGGWNPVGLH